MNNRLRLQGLLDLIGDERATVTINSRMQEPGAINPTGSPMEISITTEYLTIRRMEVWCELADLLDAFGISSVRDVPSYKQQGPFSFTIQRSLVVG